MAFRECCTRVEGVLIRFVPLLLLVFFTFFGAFLFHLIEEPHELTLRSSRNNQLREFREAVARRIDHVYQQGVEETREVKYNRTLVVLEETYQKRFLKIHEETGRTKWTFWGSLFYSITIYTTVGYGHLIPVTTRGKLATCLYSLVGFPIFILALIHCGWLLAWLLKRLFPCCRRVSCCVAREFEGLKLSAQLEAEMTVLRFPLSILLLIAVFWLFFTAGLVLLWENWTYADSLYFSFITYTTIGLGDLVPTDYNCQWLVGVFTIFALILLAAAVIIIQEKFEVLEKSLKRSIEVQYQAMLTEGEEWGVDMGGSEEEMKFMVGRMVAQMPPAAPLLYRLLPPRRKEEIFVYFRRKAFRKSMGTQTEVIPFGERYRMGAIGEEKRSHDDINSLVLMCGY